MALKPWYKIVTPREDLVEGRPLDASEFAVHLDHVKNGTAPKDYTDPERFFHRTYMTRTLLDIASQTVRRFAGITTETSPVFNLTTQFGGGKTHALTLLYHLARLGPEAKELHGVDRILQNAQIDELVKARTFVFVGTEFSSVTGRGGNGEPLRKTPWGELAWQIGGKEGYELFARLDEKYIPPAGDDLDKLFDKNQAYLLLFDEVLNYVSKHRRYHDLAAQFYNFIQTLTEFVRSRDNMVLAVSIPASEMEMNTEDQADYDRFKKLLDRLGKAMMMAAENETKNIIRRRLFDWGGLPKEARKVIGEYIQWIKEHQSHLNFNIDTARQEFEEAYPFHPALLSLFERKWQTLPRFQRTRGILRLLALWVARAYSDGYKQRTKDPLIALGTAPLDDPNFRSAVFEQLGENRLEAAVTTDIAGREDSHAIRLDNEAIEAIKNTQLHRKCATTIFFESNGGQTREGLATIPEIKLSVGEPGLDIGLIDGVLQSLLENCYYLTASNNKFKFSTRENLIKRFTDRKAGVDARQVKELVEETIRKVFNQGRVLDTIMFPDKNNQITDRPQLSLVVLDPENEYSEKTTWGFLNDAIQNYGSTARIFKSAILFAVADTTHAMKEEAKKYLAWETIYNESSELNLEADQLKQIRANMERARKDLTEQVWRSYKYLILLNRDNELEEKDLGLIHSSQARSITELYKNRLISDGELIEELSPNFLVRNWPPAFTEWSTIGVRDAFFQSPQFPRLTQPDLIKKTISSGVKKGVLAYVGKSRGKYEPFYFEEQISPEEIEITDEMFIIKGEEAEKYKRPPELKFLVITPDQVSIKPGSSYTFNVKGYDQHEEEIELESLTWEASAGEINEKGVYTANETEGTYQVTASSGDIRASALVVVTKKEYIPDPAPSPTGKVIFKWSGDLDPRKWTVFYTKVLAKFANNPTLRIAVSFEVEEQASVAESKKNETKTALRELGLEDNI